MKAVVVVFPGSNRDGDIAQALAQAGAQVEKLWYAKDELPPGTDLVVLPGGFSYGDYLRCGAISARAPVMDAVRRHCGRGGLVLGVCNGFQILCESGLLPGILMRNRKLKFVCHRQHLLVERNDTAFTNAYRNKSVINVCVAHAEGNYTVAADELERIEKEGLVAFRYCDQEGELTDKANFNGSMNSIAGIYSEKRNILGLMPHPENLIDPLIGGTDGRGLFESLVGSFKKAA